MKPDEKLLQDFHEILDGKAPSAGKKSKWFKTCSRFAVSLSPIFSSSNYAFGEISQKVLASTLRELEENGFASRTVTHTTPPQVEYALTDLGQEFLDPVRGLADWVVANSARMDAARSAYARRRDGE
jgi:predicted transcriptional regulator